MCQYQELAIGENGYIIRCRHCRHYQLCFAGVILSLAHSEFVQLLRQIAASDYQPGELYPHQRSIVLATPKQGIHLLLSPAELVLLKQMAETADNETRALDLLALFQ